MVGTGPGSIAGVGSEHFDLGCAELKAVSGYVVFDRRADIVGLSEESVVGLGMRIVADPDFARPEVGEHRGHAADVIGVGMGESDYVEAADSARPEICGDDLFANVEIGHAGRRAKGRASGIDEQGLAVGGHD